MKSHARRNQPVRQTSPSRLRTLTFAVIVVMVLGTAGYLLVSAFSSKTPAPAANTIDISASMGGFNTNEIRVKVGQPITVRLTSQDNSHHTDGGGQHQWAVDEFGASVIAPPLGNNSVTFTPDKVGTYTFYCDICCGGRANPTMQGTLIVEA
ncbi:MAG: cupredoxin domain-containing protein [Anaerolineaceae bacterium]|nr:cupredoxin domain-containing protein [Anaerolineaceae bacterium]